MFDSDQFVENSYLIDFNVLDASYFSFLYVMLLIDVFILIHSMVYLQKKRLLLTTKCTELCGVIFLIQATCVLTCRNNACSKNSLLYLNNILLGTICTLVIQLCDLAIIFFRYKCVATNFAPRTQIITILYIILLSFLWIPIYTLCPLFVDMNIKSSTEAIVMIMTIYYGGYIIYNILFTIKMIRNIQKLLLVSESSLSRQNMLNILLRKNLIHNFLSILNLTLLIYWKPFGILLYSFLNILSKHTLINLRLEIFMLKVDIYLYYDYIYAYLNTVFYQYYYYCFCCCCYSTSTSTKTYPTKINIHNQQGMLKFHQPQRFIYNPKTKAFLPYKNTSKIVAWDVTTPYYNGLNSNKYNNNNNQLALENHKYDHHHHNNNNNNNNELDWNDYNQLKGMDGNIKDKMNNNNNNNNNKVMDNSTSSNNISVTRRHNTPVELGADKDLDQMLREELARCFRFDTVPSG